MWSPLRRAALGALRGCTAARSAPGCAASALHTGALPEQARLVALLGAARSLAAPPAAARLAGAEAWQLAALWRGLPAALIDTPSLYRICPPVEGSLEVGEEGGEAPRCDGRARSSRPQLSHPAFLSPMLAHTKRTYQPSVLIRKRRHGFLGRAATPTGRRVLAARRSKGRRVLSA